MITLVVLGLFAFLWYRCEVDITFNDGREYHKKAKTWGIKITLGE